MSWNAVAQCTQLCKPPPPPPPWTVVCSKHDCSIDSANLSVQTTGGGVEHKIVVVLMGIAIVGVNPRLICNFFKSHSVRPPIKHINISSVNTRPYF